MIISSNGKTITPDSPDELLVDVNNLLRYFIVYQQLNKQKRKDLASSLINTIILATFWEYLDKDKINHSSAMDSMIEASWFYTDKFLEQFGKGKQND